MPERTVKVKYEVDVSPLEKLRKAQAAYRKELRASIDQTRLLLSAQKQTGQGFQQQAEAARQASQSLGQNAQAAQESAQATRDNSQAQQDQTQTINNLNQKISGLNDRIKKLEEAQNKSSSSTKKNTASWVKNAKTLVFWTIGAASVFRLVQKIRRAFLDTIKTLFENTEEYKRLKEAQDRLKVSIVAATGGTEDWLKRLDSLAKVIDSISSGLIQASATISGFSALMRVATKDGESLFKVMTGIVALAQGQPGIFFSQFAQAAEENVDLATAFLDAYNATLANSAELEERFRIANMKTARALDESKDKVDRLKDAEKNLADLQEALADAQKRRLEELADLERERLRRLQDINTEFQRDLADLAVKGARKRQDIEIAFRRRIEDLERKRNEQRTRIAEALALKLLRIELRFREQMIRIAENFDDAIFDAIQKRDATAALLAIRRRRRDEGRARRERDNSITLAQAEAQAKRNQAARSLENQRQDAILARQRALEDLRRDQQREREDIQKDYDRKMEDLGVFLQRQRDDIELDYQRRLARAREQYKQEEAEYQAHLDTQHQKLQSHIARTQVEFNKLALLNQSALPTSFTPATGGGSPGTTGYGFARGGDMTFTKPTTIQVAERGAERVVAQPVTPGAGGFSGTMRHQISGSIDAAMAGFAGRLGPMITEQVVSVMGEVLN